MKPIRAGHPALTSTLGSEHQPPDSLARKPGFEGVKKLACHPSHTRSRVGSPYLQSSLVLTLLSHLPYCSQRQCCFMGAFKQVGVSGQDRQQCPRRCWAPQSSAMEALKLPPQPGQEAGRAQQGVGPWCLLFPTLGERQCGGVESVGFEFTWT